MSDQDTSNPWATSTETTPAPAAPSNPWGSTSADDSAATSAPGADDWLIEAALPGDASAPAFDWAQPFDGAVIPLDEWVDSGLTWTVDNFRPAFQAVRVPIDATLNGIEHGLLAVPPLSALQAWFIFGETLAVIQVVGFGVAIAGVALARR